MDSKPLSVLVTGSSGFIGTHVVRQLHRAGHRVMALDQMPPKEPLPDGVRFYCCDIRQGMLPNGGFDAVVHRAALAGVRPSMDRQLDYEITNVIGTLRLLDHCRRFGTPHFVFASSSSVYGPDTPLPAEETAIPDPCSPYALTKLHGEHWGRLYSRLHGLRFLALRLFSVWGPGQRPDLALEAFRRKIDAGNPGKNLGDYITQRKAAEKRAAATAKPAPAATAPKPVFKPATKQPAKPAAPINKYFDAPEAVVRQAALHRLSPAADKAEAIKELEFRGFNVSADGIVSQSTRGGRAAKNSK